MKLNKFLPITLLAGVLMLSACGSKGNDNSGDSGSGGDSTPTGPYTITEAEFATLKAKMASPKIFIEGNFTVDLTLSGSTFKNKFANGKVDCYVQGEHYVLDIDVSTYDATKQTANGDMYEYDEDDEAWSKDASIIDVGAFASYSLGFETVFAFSPSSLDSFTYNEDTRFYTGSKTMGDDTYVTKFMVKDGQFLSYEVVGMFGYEFSDYGTTTVILPELAA